jgi:hypothetical protein
MTPTDHPPAQEPIALWRRRCTGKRWRLVGFYPSVSAALRAVGSKGDYHVALAGEDPNDRTTNLSFARVRLAEMPACTPPVSGHPRCECGKPAAGIYCRTCRACLAAEDAEPGTAPRNGSDDALP